MPTSWKDVDVRCPFFRQRKAGPDGCRILCDGITEGGSLSHRFRDRAQMEGHLHEFCESSYIRCELHNALQRVHSRPGGTVVQEIIPDADSQFRLRECGCGAQAGYVGYDTDEWAVRCTVCGREGVRGKLRHDVQTHWNSGGRLE